MIKARREYEIKLAREYQIDLSKSLWAFNRKELVKNLLEFINQESDGIFDVDLEDMIEEGYHRYSYGITHIHPKPIIRVRDFTRGNRSGLTTVDLKFRKGNSMEEMLKMPGKPSDKYKQSAIQKVEQDVHACDIRWSRGTRLFLDYSPNLESINDAISLFPQLAEMEHIESATLAKEVFDVYYWQSSYTGTTKNGIRFKFTLTFMYKSITDAFTSGVIPKKDGEFSIRLFAKNEGHSREFDHEHLVIVNDLFEALVWSEWNVDPDLDCLTNPERNPEDLEIWRKPVP